MCKKVERRQESVPEVKKVCEKLRKFYLFRKCVRTTSRTEIFYSGKLH